MKTTKNSNPNFSFKMIQILTVNITVKRSPDLNEEKKKLKINEDEGTRLLSTLDRIYCFSIFLIFWFRKRIFNLTPKVPNMESIPEDEEIENGRQNPNLNPYTKARRRDSVCSSNSSSGQDSDSEQVRTVRESLTWKRNSLARFDTVCQQCEISPLIPPFFCNSATQVQK